MKNLHALFCLFAILGIAVLCSQSASAQDDNRAGVMNRLDRLEKQVQQLAQERAQTGERPGIGPENRPGMPPQDGAFNQPRGGFRGTPAFRCLVAIVRTAVAVIIVINILLAIWIYGDIRKRGEGSGLFIILALLAGIPGTILYALVRIGDRKPATV